ncbi:uncharacterized protein LOC144745893 isoform X1 [Ciona intestinalis]
MFGPINMDEDSDDDEDDDDSTTNMYTGFSGGQGQSPFRGPPGGMRPIGGRVTPMGGGMRPISGGTGGPTSGRGGFGSGRLGGALSPAMRQCMQGCATNNACLTRSQAWSAIRSTTAVCISCVRQQCGKYALTLPIVYDRNLYEVEHDHLLCKHRNNSTATNERDIELCDLCSNQLPVLPTAFHGGTNANAAMPHLPC